MAIWGTVLRLGSALGGLGLGWAAELFGVRPVIVAAALAAALSIPLAARALGRSAAWGG